MSIFDEYVTQMRTIKVRGSEKEFVVGKIVCIGRNFADHGGDTVRAKLAGWTTLTNHVIMA